MDILLLVLELSTFNYDMTFCYTVIALLVLCGSDACEDEEGSRCKSYATPVAVIRNED